MKLILVLSESYRVEDFFEQKLTHVYWEIGRAHV